MRAKWTKFLVLASLLLLTSPVVLSAESPVGDTQVQLLLLTRAVARLQTEIDTLRQQQLRDQELGAKVAVLDKEMSELRQMLATSLSLPAPQRAVQPGVKPAKTYFVPAGW